MINFNKKYIYGYAFCLLAVFSILPVNTKARLTNPGIPEYEIKAVWDNFEKNHKKDHTGGNYPYMTYFRNAAKKYDLPLTLIMAVARGESRYNTKAVSSANCIGIMQIQWPGTAKHLGIFKKKDLFDPKTNIDAGARYLRELIKRYNGSIYHALAAYNYGPGKVSINKVPNGAQWYAAYIYFDNLELILNSEYSKSHLLLVNEYTSYQMALRFATYWGKQAPDIPMEIRKSNKFTYDLHITYKSSKDRVQYITRFIKVTGFTPLGIKKMKGASI